MSRHHIHYEFTAPPQKYFVDEMDGYQEDFSDNECVENLPTVHGIPPSMMGDIYCGNPAIVPVQVVPHVLKVAQVPPKQHSEQYIQQPFYNRNMVQSPRTYYPKVFEPSREYYPVTTTSQHDGHYGTEAYRSAYHNVEQFSINYREPSHQPEYPSRPPQKPGTGKRYPITVPTPKYYRRSSSSSVYKRPSALCLPCATQPDPAVIRRTKRAPVSNYHGTSDVESMRMESPKKGGYKHTSDFENLHVVDSQGDSKPKGNFEDVFEEMEKGVLSQKKDEKSDISKYAKLMKPRMPTSVRVRQEKCKSKIPKRTMPINTNNNNSSNKANEQCSSQKESLSMTTNSLEKLLNQLRKCDESCRNTPAEESNDQPKESEKRETRERKEVLESERMSFNYHDINSNKFAKCDLRNMPDPLTIQDLTNKMRPSSSISPSFRPKQVSSSKPTLDDNCALELHRSKSYIVNLIDRALSKELGTIPNTRNPKEFENLNPKRAIELMNRHIGKVDRETEDLNSSLTETNTSNFGSQHQMDEDIISQSKICCCSAEEPVYIKQLKQLRWGHLKHIQREVKRLEDLERFLDSCSITTIPEL